MTKKLSNLERIQKEYELEILHQQREDLYQHPQLRHLFLELTSRCNARCEHCGSRCDNKEQGEEISADLLKKTLKEVADCYDPSTVFLDVTGGEPLMRKDMYDILEYATDLGFYWGMTTNGMLITDKVADKLEKAGMKSISISIDGLKETHENFRKVPNCYEKVLHALDRMLASKTVQIVHVTTVVTKNNIHELEDLYQLLLKHNLTNWRIVNCDPIGRANDNKDLFLDMDDFKYMLKFIDEKNKEGKMKEVTYGCSHFLGLNGEKKYRNFNFICMAGIMVGSVLSNGDIFVCPNVPRRKELIQGNIKTDSFVNVWETKYKEFRNPDRTSNKTCKRCKYWRYCGGDSFHTWNFDENKPNICLKSIFKDI